MSQGMLKTQKHTLATGNCLENLPSDVLNNILSRLPFSSLLQFKATSRIYRDLASAMSLYLLKQQSLNPSLLMINKFTFNGQLTFVKNDPTHGYDKIARKISPIWKPRKEFDKSFSLVGCSNGLLCLRIHKVSNNDTLVICNPFVRDSTPIEIPLLKEVKKTEEDFLDFGYHPKSGAFKVVRVVFFNLVATQIDGSLSFISDSEFEILSIKTKEWRKKGRWPYELIYTQLKPGALVKGSLNWVVPNHGIISFELEEEVFFDIPLPLGFGPNYLHHVSVLKGCLSAAEFGNLINIWVMKEYRAKESWVKNFSIQSYALCRGRPKVLCELINGEILLDLYDKLASYNPKTQELKSLRIREISPMFETFVFWPTVVSAKETTEKKL